MAPQYDDVYLLVNSDCTSGASKNPRWAQYQNTDCTGSEIFPYAESSQFAGQSVAVRRLGGIRGDNLTGAQQGFDPQTNEPVVNIQFDQQGGARFARLTTENVNRPFAIILDGEVLSAPNINEPILGGQAQISGGFTVDTANNLAISLRSGALPVDLTVIEERTVGPDLGADSIRRGTLAMMIGSVAVIVLMIVTYGRFGIYSTIALAFNVLMILGIMAGLNTTLTLPGIAGFVLTIGAAVDANVLINERIREERKRGRRVIAAVENGYKEASRAIYDANITNFIAGVLLFLFGSGPVRGFAVVLVIGLFSITSCFDLILSQSSLPLEKIQLPPGFRISLYARAAGARSMTRGPAKPMSASGSAILMSPSMPRLADTPPVVGSVSTEMNGRPASPRRERI